MVCFSVKAGCAAPPPPPPPFSIIVSDGAHVSGRIPPQAFNDNQQSLFAHVVKSVKLAKTLILNSVR